MKLTYMAKVRRDENGSPVDYPKPAEGCPIATNRLNNKKSAAEGLDMQYAAWHLANGTRLKKKYRPGV